MSRADEQLAEERTGVEQGFGKLCDVLRADRQIAHELDDEAKRAEEARAAEARGRVAAARKREIRQRFARLIPGRRLYEVVGEQNVIVRAQCFVPGSFLSATPDEVAPFLERKLVAEIHSKRPAPPPTPAA